MSADRTPPPPLAPADPARGAEPRCVLFLDCDRFFFAVEAAERPDIASDSRPVIIGHDPRTSPRAIVTTANDAARAYGIRSGMSAALALRLAPDAMFLPPQFDLYRRYSARVMAILRSASPLAQQNSIDEAACEWPSGFRIEPALALRERILANVGLSVSIGIATSPLVAKMASEVAKGRADHVCLVLPGEEAAFLAPLPVRALVGVGPKAERRLRERGIGTIGELAARPREELIGLFGRAYGQYLHEASRGIDETPLRSERIVKSISAEHTFPVDTTDRRVLWQRLRAQAEEVAHRLRAEGVQAMEVAIKLRYADWQTQTRQLRLAAPTDEATVLAAGGAALMRRHWERQRPVRLIGLRAGLLTPAGVFAQLPLLDAPPFAG